MELAGDPAALLFLCVSQFSAQLFARSFRFFAFANFASQLLVGLFEVRVRYRTRNILGAVPILGGLPRFLIDLPGSADQYPISLAPYATERSFPVVIRGGVPIIVRARVASLIGGASVTLDSVRIERIPVSRTNMLWINDYVTRNYLQR